MKFLRSPVMFRCKQNLPRRDSHNARCSRWRKIEQLEPRTMLSASPIAGRPYFDLGPSDGVAWDQPRVTVQFIDELQRAIGPLTFNTWLLDTGANTILAFQTAVGDMTGPPAYQTQGRFAELGIGGTQLFDISKSYQMDFAGDSGERNTRLDTRIISDATRDVSIFGPYGIVGMPAMTERVTTLDFTPWTTIDPLSLDLFMKVDFRDDVPSYSGPRYTVKVDNRYEYFPEPHVIPLGGPTPAWADIPYLTAQLKHNEKISQGNFLYDTGAQVSILSQRMAFELGLDSNGDGMLDSKDASFAREETVGGIGGQTTVPVFLIDEVHVPTEQGPDLVWTDLQWLVLDIDPGIDAVFGFDNMTSGWIEAAAVNGKSGYIMQSHLDFRNYEATGEGKIYFDINPEIHAVVDPNGPGAIVDELGGLTSVSETGVADTYTLRLSQAPTANVRVVLASPGDQQATAVDALNPSNGFLDFTPSNWSQPQTVLVTAIDDSIEESFHRTFVRHVSSSADPAYQNVGMPRVVVNITDNDFPGVMLIPSDGATIVSEGGFSDTYQVVLTYPPTAPVTIGLSNLQNQVTAVSQATGANSLQFTPGNWQVPQTVVVTAVDDLLNEGTHKTYVNHSLSTADLIFAQAFILQEIVTIIDNDSTDSVPPKVIDVIVGSSQWNSAFIDAIDGGGTGAGNGLGMSLTGTGQLRNLPWINIDRLYVQFSENVGASFSPSKLRLVGANVADYVPVLTPVYGPDGSNRLTLKFNSPIGSDILLLALADSITDAAGNALDGEWADGLSTVSGNATAGGRFLFRLDVLPGDVNDNGGVNTTDLLDDYGMRNTLVSSQAASMFDVNGNGGVNTTDLFDIYTFRNTVLPAPPNPPIALMNSSTYAGTGKEGSSSIQQNSKSLTRQRPYKFEDLSILTLGLTGPDHDPRVLFAREAVQKLHSKLTIDAELIAAPNSIRESNRVHLTSELISDSLGIPAETFPIIENWPKKVDAFWSSYKYAAEGSKFILGVDETAEGRFAGPWSQVQGEVGRASQQLDSVVERAEYEPLEGPHLTVASDGLGENIGVGRSRAAR